MRTFKVRVFEVDNNLGYLIQQSTKDSTQEILAYFYGVAQFVLSDLIKTSKASFLNKTIVLFYKDTPISYRVQLSGPSFQRSEVTGVNVAVSFPKMSQRHDTSELMNAIVESGLGLTSEANMKEFERPNLKAPRCLKDIKMRQHKQRDKLEGT